MRVLIATGGTGGHIYPALALADAMKEKDPQTEILFGGTAERMESTETVSYTHLCRLRCRAAGD